MDMCYLACAYRTPSGYCGSTGGAATCPHRQKKQTNADRIRSMSDEELAMALPFPQCPPHKGKCTFSTMIANSCDQCWLDWLRQEVET